MSVGLATPKDAVLRYGLTAADASSPESLYQNFKRFVFLAQIPSSHASPPEIMVTLTQGRLMVEDLGEQASYGELGTS